MTCPHTRVHVQIRSEVAEVAGAEQVALYVRNPRCLDCDQEFRFVGQNTVDAEQRVLTTRLSPHRTQ